MELSPVGEAHGKDRTASLPINWTWAIRFLIPSFALGMWTPIFHIPALRLFQGPSLEI